MAKLAGSNRPASRSDPGAQALPTVDPTAGDDGDTQPSRSAGPEDTKITTAAEAFAKAWLRRDLSASDWHALITPLSTAPLAENLVGVDPTTVPATRTIGTPTVSLRAELYAQAVVVVDTGKLVLGLAKQKGRWLVDTVDLDRT
jgi:hypothetical protein